MTLFGTKTMSETEELVPLQTGVNAPHSQSPQASPKPVAIQDYGSVGPPSVARKHIPNVDPSSFTSRGNALIDLVLAYQPNTMDATQIHYRETFEAKLRQHGLFLEHQDISQSQDWKTCFVKIHCPWELMAKVAELSRVKVPLQASDVKQNREDECGYKCIECCCCCCQPGELETPYKMPDTAPNFTTEFQRSHFRKYMVQDPNIFFSQTQRINIVWEIIERITVSADEALQRGSVLLTGHQDGNSVGLSFLLSRGVYIAAYPLHDADTKVDPLNKKKKPTELWPLRPWLYEAWARPGRWYKYQPLDQIRSYFGEQVAIYFAWLGFYTSMLIPLSVVGIICSIIGVFNMLFSDPVADDFCDGLNNTVVCRKCADDVCPLTKLEDECIYAIATSIFNNYTTLFFALFTSLWCVFFLEFWKRYQATLACKWDTFDVEKEFQPPRPEYMATAKSKRLNPITQEYEPHVPARSKAQRICGSIVTVGFLVTLVVAVIAGIIIYKMIMIVVYHNLHSGFIELVGSDMMTTVTASVISAVAIVLLEKVYGWVAWKLTENEYPRTDSDFEISYTYKMYIFQFVNYYALLFYLAFLQPNISGIPKGDTLMSDRCAASGCTFNVTVQLCIVLIVKQVTNNIAELGIPMFSNWCKRRGNVDATADNEYTRYEKDFDLTPLPEFGMFDEYFEMVMQYGFVTMFVAAFPLAPLFALLNNVIEIRLDAFKFISEFRRPVPVRSADIGTWYDILEFVSHLAVLTNACVIAFTTDLVERLVYVGHYSSDFSLDGYLEWSMSYFNTSDWAKPDLGMMEDGITEVQFCRYKGFYSPPWAEDPYSINEAWWRVWFAKLVFVLVFEHVIFFTQAVIQYAVPDIPDDVSLHVERNRYLAKASAYQVEASRAAPPAAKGLKKRAGSDKTGSTQSVKDDETQMF